MSFQEVGFIGLGLIGGSVALKLKEIYPNVTIKATAGRESTIDEAYHMGLIENSHKIPLSEFSNCDYIFLHSFAATFSLVSLGSLYSLGFRAFFIFVFSRFHIVYSCLL